LNERSKNINPINFCPNCGARTVPGKRFCADCGERLDIQPPSGRADRQQQSTRPEPQYRQIQPEPPPRRYPQAEEQPEQPVRKKKGKAAKILAVVFIILAVAAAFGYFYIRGALGTAPDMQAKPRGTERMRASVLDSSARDTAKYTFLILGTDKGEYNTDVIMALTFDTSAHTLDIVNIPRDTLANVSWSNKKANSILANMRAKFKGEQNSDAKAMDATVEAFADILGFETDYCVTVNIEAFVSLVDAVGGVDFDVPVNMNYDDKAGGLSIHYSKGTHHLSGQQALEVLRFRSGYSNADIGRIGTQQSFLKSAAEQILAKRSSLNVAELAGIFLKNVKTNMKLSDLIWFGKEFLKLDAANISFVTMPGNYGDSVNRQSYVTINVAEWLKLCNSTFNPFKSDITENDVSILTRGANKRLYVTDGNRQGDASWGS